MDVYVTDGGAPYGGGIYRVMVEGKVYDTFVLRKGPPLTHSQLVDVQLGYSEYLNAQE